MSYKAKIIASEIGTDRIGINARIIRSEDGVEVGKILSVKPASETPAYTASVNELLDAHPDFEPNENY